MHSSTNVLITGAAGFIGANLIERLMAQGIAPHGVIDPHGDRWRLDEMKKSNEQFHAHEVDLRDREGIRRLVSAIKPRVIYHLAGYGGHPYQRDGHRTMETMVMGTMHLVSACAEQGFDLFVNAGCSSEYGWKSRPMSEEDALVPNSYYSVAKASQTIYCQFMSRSLDLPLVTLRLFPVYGPWEEPVRLVPTIITRSLRGEDLQLAAPETARDFIFVDDVVDALLAAEQLKDTRGQIFNIGSGKQSTIKEVVDSVLDITGARVKSLWHAIPSRPWDTQMWIADNSKFRKLTHWGPRVNMEQGLAKTAEWMKGHIDIYTRLQEERSS